jgi:hypothetical protein
MLGNFYNERAEPVLPPGTRRTELRSHVFTFLHAKYGNLVADWATNEVYFTWDQPPSEFCICPVSDTISTFECSADRITEQYLDGTFAQLVLTPDVREMVWVPDSSAAPTKRNAYAAALAGALAASVGFLALAYCLTCSYRPRWW